jgi:alpha-ketoglutarate-dependent taurine dioxygenase
MLSNCAKVIEHLPQTMMNFLKTAYLKISEYSQAAASTKVQDEFAIKLIDTYREKEILRLFLPSSHQNRCNPDSVKLISGTTEDETRLIFKEIQRALYHQDILKKIKFQKNDVLIFNNRIFLHGRERFLQPTKRILNRIQLCQN